jgi:hypothetical protein
MCTLGAISGKYLFKTRDLWSGAERGEEVATGRGRYRYVGVRGMTTPLERGLNSGINEAGVAVAITFVDHVSMEEAIATRTPRGVLVEEILRTCGDLPDVMRLIADFISVPLVGGNIVILTPNGDAVLEQLYPRFAIELVDTPVIVRTNHFKNLKVNGDLYGDRDNCNTRYARMTSLLVNGHATGTICRDYIKAALSDHSGPHPICSHAGSLQTVSSAIYDLQARSLEYTYGSPCAGNWQQFSAK